MKQFKYIASCLSVVLLTLLFLYFPNAYFRYAEQESVGAPPRDIHLEPSNEVLTMQEALRFIYDNVSSCLYTMTDNTQSESDYQADCLKIIEDVFGPKSDSVTAETLSNTVKSHATQTTNTEKFLTVAKNQVIALNIVSVQFETPDYANCLHICYEESTKAAISITVFDITQKPKPPYAANEFTKDVENNPNILAYYENLEFDNGFEFTYYAYDGSIDGVRLKVGLTDEHKAIDEIIY